MYHKIKVQISNRHVHLTKETYEKLFDEPLTKKKDLNQIGQFAANQTVDILTDKFEFNNVRIVGPFRKYNQVEVSNNDARKLGIKPPVRTSGDLSGGETITIRTPKNTVKLEESCIIANRHVHFNTTEAAKYKVTNQDRLKIHILGEKRGTIEAYAKVSDDGYYELHLDTDDANAFLLNSDDEVILEIDD